MKTYRYKIKDLNDIFFKENNNMALNGMRTKQNQCLPRH